VTARSAHSRCFDAIAAHLAANTGRASNTQLVVEIPRAQKVGSIPEPVPRARGGCKQRSEDAQRLYGQPVRAERGNVSK